MTRLWWGRKFGVCEKKVASKEDGGVRKDRVRDGVEARFHRALKEFEAFPSMLERH